MCVLVVDSEFWLFLFVFAIYFRLTYINKRSVCGCLSVFGVHARLFAKNSGDSQKDLKVLLTSHEDRTHSPAKPAETDRERRKNKCTCAQISRPPYDAPSSGVCVHASALKSRSFHIIQFFFCLFFFVVLDYTTEINCGK